MEVPDRRRWLHRSDRHSIVLTCKQTRGSTPSPALVSILQGMAMKIGSFGSKLKKLPEPPVPEKYDTFDWCETEVRLRPFVASYPMLAYAAHINHENFLTGVPFGDVLHKVIKASILEEDWELFVALSEENETDLDELWELSQHLFARWTTLPIQRVSGSSNGHSEKTVEDVSSLLSSGPPLDLSPQASLEAPTPEPDQPTSD